MVKARDVMCWNWSTTMIFGKSPKIDVKCGKCCKWHSTRLSLNAMKHGNSYVVCPYCGEVNDTMLKVE